MSSVPKSVEMMLEKFNRRKEPHHRKRYQVAVVVHATSVKRLIGELEEVIRNLEEGGVGYVGSGVGYYATYHYASTKENRKKKGVCSGRSIGPSRTRPAGKPNQGRPTESPAMSNCINCGTNKNVGATGLCSDCFLGSPVSHWPSKPTRNGKFCVKGFALCPVEITMIVEARSPEEAEAIAKANFKNRNQTRSKAITRVWEDADESCAYDWEPTVEPETQQ